MSDHEITKTLIDKAIEALHSNDIAKYQIAVSNLQLASAQLEKSRTKNNIKEIVSNPMLLLVIGAFITGWIVPAVALQWQTNEHELELETALVTEMSETVIRFLTAMQIVVLNQTGYPVDFSNEEYDQAYQDWVLSKGVISSKLMAYYPDSPQLSEEWKRYGDLLEGVYALPGYNGTTKVKSIQDLNSKYFSNDSDYSINLEYLAYPYNSSGGLQSFTSDIDEFDYKGEWYALRDATLEKIDSIIQQAIKMKLSAK